MASEPGWELRVDRTPFSIASSFNEAETQDQACWRSPTPPQPAARLQLMRRLIPRISPEESSRAGARLNAT